jgi:DNA-binding MarR family transcriptional regulator
MFTAYRFLLWCNLVSFLLLSVIFSVKTVTKNDTKITEKEKQILIFIINNGPSKVIEISNALGFSGTTIKNILYKLVGDDLISSSGTIKDNRYFVNKN